MTYLTGLILCIMAFVSGYVLGHRVGVNTGTKNAIRRLNDALSAGKRSGRL